MICILASNFKNYIKKNDIKISCPIDNTNGLVDQLKDNIIRTKKVVFVASDINDSYEKVSSYANIFFESMSMVGITFLEYFILYGDNMDKAAEYINDSDLVFLCGGSTYNQYIFFEIINLRYLLENYSGIVIGQSAGALNMAIDVFNSPENKEESEPIYFDGLGLTNINIEPHFEFDDSVFDENEKYQRDFIIKESYKRTIYGQCDGSHILINNSNKVMICGKTYLIKNGNIDLICNDGESILINN